VARGLLALVGALPQFALVSGQLAFVRTRCRVRGYRGLLRTEFGLWTLGTVLVPAGVFAAVPAVVALGSLGLFAALALFARATTIPRAGSSQAERRWLYAYRILWSSWPEARSWAPAWAGRSHGSSADARRYGG
jgi:hypothetical protein